MLQRFKRRWEDVRTLTRLCTSAEQIACQQGRQKPGSEHFILAALSLPDASAAQAFAAVGITAQQFRDALAAQHADALAAIGITDVAVDVDEQAPPPAKPSALYEAEPSGQVLVQRLAETRGTRAGRVLLGADVLLAAAQENHTSAGRAFHKLGVSPQRLADAAQEAIGRASTSAAA